MLKKLLLLFALCALNKAQAQTPTQLTHFENNAFHSPNTEVFKFQDRLFYALENGEQEIEIWEFENQALSLVYTTPFRLCDFDLYLWRIYENKIIITGYGSFRFINFLTGVEIEEVFSNDSYFRASKPNYRFDKSLIRFKTPDQVEQVYDVELEDYVPFFEEGLLYKSATSYYYVEGTGGDKSFKKRLFFETQAEIIADDFLGFLNLIYNDVLYFSADGVIYRVEGDVVDEFPLFDAYVSELFLGEDDQFYAIEYASPNRFLHILDGDLNLVDSKDVGNFFGYNIDAISDDKVFFSYEDFSAKEYVFWDVVQDTIMEIGFSDSEFVHVEDSLIFNTFWDYGNPKMEVLNTRTLALKMIELPPFELNEIDEGKRIFKKDGRYFMTLYDDENGFGFYEYDFQTNDITPGTAFLQKNYGVGPSIECTGEWIYISDFDEYSRQIKVYDPEAADGIYAHEIEAGLDGDIAAIDGKFYYFLDHDFGGTPPSDSNYVDLVVFDPDSKTTTTLVEAISYTAHLDYSRYKVGGRYIILPYLFDATKSEVYDTEKNVRFPITSMQKELLRRIDRITDNYMYAHFGGLFKMEIDDPTTVELIHPDNTSQPRVLTGDAVAFAVNDSLFYYDGQTLKNYFFDENISFFYDYVSPDKRYIAYNFLQNGEPGIVLYDRVQDVAKKIRKNAFVSYALELYFSNDYLFHFDRINDQEYNLFSYHLETEAVDSVIVTSHWILSLYDGELHIENPEAATISIFNYDLDLIEVVPSDGLFNVYNNINLPRQKALVNPRVIYSYRSHGSSNFIHTRINLYDAEERTVSSYFDCESGLQLHDFEQKDSILYCLASNDDEGHQVYKIDIENYVTNVKEAPQVIAFAELELFPNPTADALHFNKKYDHICIYNAAGQLVFYKKESTDRLKINHLSSGLYFVKAMYQNEFYNGKFVVERE